MEIPAIAADDEEMNAIFRCAHSVKGGAATFGFSDVAVNNTFALGYEEVDRNGAVVAGTQRPLTQFDPSQQTVCLPLGPGQTPVHETWELVQLSTENHNFHIH